MLELQRARDSWQAEAERLALMAPTVIAAPALVATPEAAAPALADPEQRPSLLRYWFGLRAAG